MATSDLKKKAVRGAGVNVIAHSISFVLHAVGVIVLARLLMPRDFGLVAMVTAFSMWVMNFGINGFTEYIIQKKDITAEEVNSIFWTHLSIATTLALAFVLFGFVLVDFYKEPALFWIATAMASSFILYALYTSHFALLQREMKFSFLAVIEVIAVVLSTGLSIGAAIGGMGYWAIVTRQLILPIVAVIAAWCISPWRPQRPKILANTFPVLKYALKIYCNFSLNYFTRNIDKILLGRVHGSVVLGIYDRAYYLSQMPAEQILRPLNSVALATLSRIREDKKRFITYYIKALSTASFLGTMATVVLFLTAQDLVLLLLGPKWTETGSVLMALTPGITALLISSTCSWLHLSLGKPGRWLRWNIVAFIITILSFIIALPYGAVAMGIAYSAKTYILLFPGLWYAGRPIQLRFGDIASAVWPYLSAAVLVAVSWICLSVCWSPLSIFLSQLPLALRVGFVAITASISYLMFTAILERSFKSVYEIVSLVKLFLSRS